VLRKDKVGHEHFTAPTILPVIGVIACGFLTGPWTGRNPEQYTIAGVLLAIGVVLWAITAMINRATGQRPAEMEDIGGPGPVN
jgi:APA family basic amino acid/polyamine antiporter